MRVSSAEFLMKFGELSDKASSEPVIITRNGRDRLVLVSAEEFERMSRNATWSRPVDERSEQA